MNVNTNRGLKLTKREKQLLVDAHALIHLIAKHGNEQQEEIGTLAADKVGDLLDSLVPADESTLVGAK